jgi:hypothetical protein
MTGQKWNLTALGERLGISLSQVRYHIRTGRFSEPTHKDAPHLTYRYWTDAEVAEIEKQWVEYKAGRKMRSRKVTA